MRHRQQRATTVARAGLVVGVALTAATPLWPQPQAAGTGAQRTPRELLAFTESIGLTGQVAFLDENGHVITDASGTVGELVRLPLDRDVLEACRPDLSDVRLFHGEREIAYAVRRTPPSGRRLLTTFEPELGPRVDRSAASVDPRAPLRQTESYTVEAPPAGEPGQWILDLDVPPRHGAFVRSARLSWLDDAGADPRPFWEGSLFRLEDGRRHQAVELPAVDGSWLLVELEGQEGERELEPLEPEFLYRRTEDFSWSGPDLTVDLEVRHERRDGTDVYRFELPPGLAPSALRVRTATGTYRRPARVLGARNEREPLRLLGSSILRGVAGTSVDDGSDLVPVEASGASRYELHLDSGDSPPLEDLRPQAVVRAPELVFEWPGEGVELLYGGGRVRPPDYDLSSLLPAGGTGVLAAGDVTLARALLHSADLPRVFLSDVRGRRNPDYLDEPLLAFLQRPGSAVDPGPFPFVSELRLEASPSGLHRVALGPATLARLDPDLDALRFVDERGQWPYLIAPAERWTTELELDEEQDGERTRLTLRLPEGLRTDGTDGGSDSGLRADRLELTVDAPFFDRAAELATSGDGGEETVVHRGRLTGAGPRTAFYSPNVERRSVTLAFPEGPAGTLVLTVDNGDDAPLPFLSGELSGTGREALLVAPEGTYTALLGERRSGSVDPPSYELERAADLVRSLRGTDTTLPAPEPNPDLAGTSWGDLPWQTVLLWAAVVAAVLGLLWVTLRSVAAD